MNIDINKIKTYSLTKRKSKVKVSEFAKVLRKGISFKGFYDSLPDILKASELRKIVDAVISARRKKKPVIFMCGAHVIKCGLGPLLIDLMKRGIISCISLNGAGIIHDFELAYCGQTSEDVGESLKSGKFGMSRQTAEFINAAVKEGNGLGMGIGEAVGLKIEKERLPNRHLSILSCGYRLDIPVTVHVAIGTDIIHQHPSFDGAACGEASAKDFYRLVEETAKLDNGGVVINFGSTVVLPEVFLKALNLARNLKGSIRNFTSANFDMYYHYRPAMNVVCRPTEGSGKGHYILGHHEIMIPLLYAAIIEKIR
ncbi:MAG: hypothetical protein PHR44_03780 [Candidatus Omnitrophica bacterium]|nr:hypothetical protein [Candidatus Omnitrophota bacterium]